MRDVYKIVKKKINKYQDELIFGGEGISKKFPHNAPVYLVENISYWVDNKNQFRKRGCIGMPTLTYTIAENVDDLQVVGIDTNSDSTFERLQLYLLSKTSRTDPNYRGKGYELTFNEETQEWNKEGDSDSYRRRLLSVITTFRNDI